MAFASFAYIYLRYTKPTFESSMILQLGDKDNAKDILDIENINSRDNELSSVVELLRSELLFERADQHIRAFDQCGDFIEQCIVVDRLQVRASFSRSGQQLAGNFGPAFSK